MFSYSLYIAVVCMCPKESSAEGDHPEGHPAAHCSHMDLHIMALEIRLMLPHPHRYPTNPVLRAITPKDTVRPMDIFPVKMTQDAIMVDVSGAATTKFKGTGRGGSDTSIDANNVFALQPRTYLEGTGPDGRHRSLVQLQKGDRSPRGAYVAV